LRNTRDKTRSEVQAELQQKYGKYDVFESDPWRGVQDWLDRASSHSQYGPQVMAYAARLLQAQRGKNAPAAEEPQPDVPIVDGQGMQTGQTYSATQLKKWQDWSWSQREAQLNERLQPLEQMRQAQEQAQQQQELERKAMQTSGQTLGTLRQDPIFKEHEATIKQALMDHPEFGANVHQAYAYVLTTKVLPGVTRGEQTKVLESLKTQAAGGTVSPSASSQTSPPAFKSPREALQYYDAHPDEAAAMANSR
jgi:hypothetical protein